MACENNVGLKPIDVAKDGEHMNTVKILRGDDHNSESPLCRRFVLILIFGDGSGGRKEDASSPQHTARCGLLQHLFSHVAPVPSWGKGIGFIDTEASQARELWVHTEPPAAR